MKIPIEELKKVLPKEKKHDHLNHSTRDEDADGGWCDTCQETFNNPTLPVIAYNQAIRDCLEEMSKVDLEMLSEERLSNIIWNIRSRMGAVRMTANEYAKAIRRELGLEDR